MKKQYIIFIPIFILFTISLLFLPNNLRYKQFIWIVLSIIISLVVGKLRINKVLKYSLIYYVISIVLLLLVLFINKFTNGSRGWLSLGFINIQPSELMKIALLLFNIRYKKMNLIIFNIINILPMILIFLEPDTGGVISLLIIYLFFLFKRLNIRQTLFVLVFLFIILLLFIYLIVFNNELIIKIFGPSIIYRLTRLSSFINDDSIQSTNALISIATSKLLYFPEMFNDFYISYILCKSIYFIFLIILCTVFILIILLNKNTIISRIAFYIIFIQCFYNLAMNLKIVPVVGLPYLFLSYGGSHIISTMILIGLSINKGNSSMVEA